MVDILSCGIVATLEGVLLDFTPVQRVIDHVLDCYYF